MILKNVCELYNFVVSFLMVKIIFLLIVYKVFLRVVLKLVFINLKYVVFELLLDLNVE